MVIITVAEKLFAANAIDPEIETEYAFISSVKSTYPIHNHDFFEIFLILEGSLVHCINGQKQLLENGSLVFIRPDDIHYYEQAQDSDCRFINLSFLDKTVNELFWYLGEGFPKSRFLEYEMPPLIILSRVEAENLRMKLDELHFIPQREKSLIKAKLRALLAEIFSRYLITFDTGEAENIPRWLTNTLNEMKVKDNFTDGINSLLKISGKSHAYLCRVFKKYLETTPIEYINNLRFGYAESLILKTDMEILDICIEIGIENLGYFYKEFKRRFRMPPSAYRKKYRSLSSRRLI